MRLVGVALAFALTAQTALAQDVEWTSSPGPYGDVVYTCNDTCAEQHTVCSHFTQAGAKGLQVEHIASEALMPWRNLDYAVAAMVFRDRGLHTAEAATGSREKGPEVVSFGGMNWAQAGYGLATFVPDLDVTLLMWPQKSELQGLRCSFAPNADVSDAIEALAVSLR